MCTYPSMTRQELPDNWEDDTSFDGPDHWGMDDRWKHLFPNSSGGRASSSSSSRNNSSGNESDGARSVDAGNGDSSVNGVKAITVDISKDDGDDGISLSSDDDHYGSSGTAAINKRKGSMVRRSLAETTPQHEQQELLLASSSLSRPSKKASSKGDKNTNDKRSTSSGRSSSSKARRDEARLTARRWRSGTRATEPASSSRAGRSGSAHEISLRDIRDLLTSSEEEEEFDDSEANITGHERNAPLASMTHGRQPANKNQIDDRRDDDAGAPQILLQRIAKRNHNSSAGGDASGSRTSNDGDGDVSAEEGRRVKEGGRGNGGGATSPFACNASSSSSEDEHLSVGALRMKDQPDEDVDGVYSSDGGLVDSDSSGDNSRFAGLTRITSSKIHRGGGRLHKKGGQKSINESPTIWSPSAHGGDNDSTRSRSNSASSPRGSLVFTDGGRGASGGASKKHPADSSGGKRARKVVPAKKGQDGWISKGGRSGGVVSPRNPVDAFQGLQASIRKNAERGLTQSKLSFPVLDS